MAQHVSKSARFQAVTANRLLDGEVVYFTSDGRWTTDLAGAVIADGKDAVEAILALALKDDYDQEVLDVYAFEVYEQPSGGYTPASVRESIRAVGPTIRPDLGKQSVA